MIVALIFGRKGSKGVKNKNIRKVLGRSLMAYPMLAAKNSGLIDDFYISTDSSKLAEIGQSYGFKLIKRPDYLASDESLLDDAIVHAYNYLKNEIGLKINILVILLCNAATVTTESINQGIKILKKDAKMKIDSCTTVVLKNQYNPIRARKIKNNMLIPAVGMSSFENASSDRGSIGDVYFSTASLWVCRPRAIENIKDGILPFKWMGKKSVPMIVDEGLDVDTEEDFAITEYWLRRRGFTESKMPYKAEVLRNKRKS